MFLPTLLRPSAIELVRFCNLSAGTGGIDESLGQAGHAYNMFLQLAANVPFSSRRLSVQTHPIVLTSSPIIMRKPNPVDNTPTTEVATPARNTRSRTQVPLQPTADVDELRIRTACTQVARTHRSTRAGGVADTQEPREPGVPPLLQAAAAKHPVALAKSQSSEVTKVGPPIGQKKKPSAKSTMKPAVSNASQGVKIAQTGPPIGQKKNAL